MNKGREFWRSLDELAEDPAFVERLHNEFPSQVEAITDPVERRTFLKLMGASLALAGVTACTKQPPEAIVPYVQQPEELVPGKPLFFATAMPLGGVALPLLVESHEGRPTKVEGNPQHGASLGATDTFAQAAILSLYDPDRARTLTEHGETRSWAQFTGAMQAAMLAQQPLKGAGLRILTESVASPTLAAQLQDLLQRYPSAKWHQWDPASREQARAGAKLAFGDYVEAQYRFDQADLILSLDSDFLASGGASVRYAHDFAARRKPQLGDRMNRLYAVESMPAATGAKADHRLGVKASEVAIVARQIAAAVGAGGAGGGTLSGSAAERGQKFVAAVAKDLQAHRGRSLVVAGDEQPAEVHALAHAMNAALGNVGTTVVYTDPVEARPVDQLASLRELVADMQAGKVDLLVILGSNPAYTAPSDVPFADAIKKVPLKVRLGLYNDETAALCQWLVPEAHFLEAWSDARAFDGTVSIVQPLIAPLYDGKSAHEVVAALSGNPNQTGYQIVRAFWSGQKAGARAGATTMAASAAVSATPDQTGVGQPQAGSAPSGPGYALPSVGARIAGNTAAAASPGAPPNPEFEANWRRWLHDGFIPDTAFAPRTITARGGAQPASTTRPAAQGMEIVFRNDPTVLDGRFANNGWLQELPKPITKITWDNAVFVSPATFEKLGLGNRASYQGGEHGQIFSPVVQVKYRGKSVYGAAFPVVGIADDMIVVHLGYGRPRGGQLANGAGFDANQVRVADAMLFDGGAEIVKTRDRYSLACTQYHHLMEGRNQIRVVTRDEFVKNPKSIREGDETPPRTLTLYPDYRYEGYRWGMAIDVNTCVGCNACVVACQAENNIPVVGKEQVLRGREMHWLRIDTYYRARNVEAKSGRNETAEELALVDPETYFQPVPCMQCENAPCEVVCPVGATVHSHEGLNDMVYNRCVGTRYCSNNCPYKVRRFNFYLYQDWDTPTYKLMRNPDVTVRSRGVMEKCTYCVQRINAGKIESEKQSRRVVDGEIETACQAVCPADAIVFGDLNDPKSRVAQLQAEERNYSLLGELNTRPRTTYLGAIRNVNPELGE